MIRRRHPTWTRQSGVTILEVLVVLTIIALISAVVGPRLLGYLGRAKSETAQLQITQLEQAVQLFYIDTGRFPAASEGLDALVTAPAGETAWDGPYVGNESALQDPWGRDYLYQDSGENGDFQISTFGRDGTSGGSGEDTDIVN